MTKESTELRKLPVYISYPTRPVWQKLKRRLLTGWPEKLKRVVTCSSKSWLHLKFLQGWIVYWYASIFLYCHRYLKLHWWKHNNLHKGRYKYQPHMQSSYLSCTMHQSYYLIVLCYYYVTRGYQLVLRAKFLKARRRRLLWYLPILIREARHVLQPTWRINVANT